MAANCWSLERFLASFLLFQGILWAMPHHSEALVPLDDEDYISGKGRISRSVSGSCRLGWEEFGDKCFKAFGKDNPETKTFSAANTYCKYLNSTLASVHSMEEHNHLVLTYPHLSHGMWIGLRRRHAGADFSWTDGTALDFTNWGTGLPNKHHLGTACVHMESRHGFKWRDGTCKARHSFICQSAKDSGDSFLDQSSGDGEGTQCTDDICGNGGSCVDDEETGDFRCVCTTGYSGGRCEEEISIPGSEVSEKIYIITGVAAVASLMILVLVIVLFRRSRRRGKNANGSVARAVEENSVSMSHCKKTQSQD